MISFVVKCLYINFIYHFFSSFSVLTFIHCVFIRGLVFIYNFYIFLTHVFSFLFQCLFITFFCFHSLFTVNYNFLEFLFSVFICCFLFILNFYLLCFHLQLNIYFECSVYKLPAISTAVFPLTKVLAKLSNAKDN